MENMDYYEILGVNRHASTAEIRDAYRKKAREHHPDTSMGVDDGDEAFRRVQKAYETLSDPLKRQEYDKAESVRFTNDPIAYARMVWANKIPKGEWV